jgi:hypothetical protein
VAGHEQLELLPSKGPPLFFFLQQFQAVRAQEEPRMFCINPEAFLLGLRCCRERRR